MTTDLPTFDARYLLTLPKALRPLVAKSMDVPQIGPHHKEGPTLRSHLEAMIKVLGLMTKADVVFGLSEEGESFITGQSDVFVRDNFMAQFVFLYNMVDFAFLHDLGKMSRMQATLDDGNEMELDLDGWQALGDKTKARVTKISYIGHDAASGDILAETGYDNPLVTKIVAVHMSAVLGFEGGVNITLFEKNFGDWTEEEIRFLLVTRYLDQAASWREDGNPDMSGFDWLYQSWKAWTDFQELTERLEGQRVNQHTLQRDLDKLRQAKDAFHDETVEDVFSRLMAAHKLPEVNVARVRAALSGIEGLSPELLQMVMQDMTTAGQLQKATGKALKQFNQPVRQALATLK